MKLTNYPEITSFRNTADATFNTDLGPVVLKFQDLPPNYSDIVEQDLPLPNPPVDGFVKESGRLVKDDMGRALPKYNFGDPKYKKEKRSVDHLRLAHTFMSSLCDDQIEFEAEMNGDASAYYAAVFKELSAAGFGLGSMVIAQKAIAAISGITDEDLTAARSDFTTPAEAG